MTNPSKNYEVELAILKEGQMQNGKEHLEIKELLCELKNEFKEFKLGADKRYAPIWVATLMYFLIAGCALYVLQAILKSIGVE